jgi:ABC-type glutathione transport system ATPase component
LVGECGCGKSTLGKTILLLQKVSSGTIRHQGNSVSEFSVEEIRGLRREIVYQDPLGSLNPRMTVLDIVRRPLEIHGLAKGEEKRKRVLELLDSVRLGRFPHEFSRGQRRRMAIARALVTGPKFVVLDERTSALDVVVKCQVLNLLRDLQERSELAYLVISHNLPVTRQMSDRIAIMYLGKIVEMPKKS